MARTAIVSTTCARARRRAATPPSDLPLDVIAAAKVVHLSGISLAIGVSACDAAFAAIDHARSHGVKVSFDTNLRLKLWPLARARAVMLEAIRATDICLPSWDDVTDLTGLTDKDAIVDFLLGLGPKVVALKLGKEGAYIATPDERRVVPGRVVQAVDATGAGDCFGGAFIARIVAGDDPFAAARYANVAAGAVDARLRRCGSDSGSRDGRTGAGRVIRSLASETNDGDKNAT